MSMMYAHIHQFGFDLVFPDEDRDEMIQRLAALMYSRHVQAVRIPQETDVADVEILNWGGVTQMRLSPLPPTNPARPVVEARLPSGGGI